jgi:hypothetical protein
MAVDTKDAQAILTRYVDDLNEVTKSRAFPPFVKKWFAEDCTLTMHHKVEGIEAAEVIWKHFLPIGTQGGQGPREVLQFIYKVDDNRVYAWRQLQGGGAPKPLYGMQETTFDDRALISEIVIHSVQDKPDVETDPNAEKTRLGRIFLEFADVFNDFFHTGDTEPLKEWCSPEVSMIIDSEFHNMGVIAPHNRINANATFSLRDVEPIGDDKVKAVVDFKNWGGVDGTMPWVVTLTPEGKVLQLDLTLAME